MEKRFTLYGTNFSISDNQAKELALKIGYRDGAALYAENAMKLYTQCGSTEKVIQKFPKVLETVFSTASESSANLLSSDYRVYTEDASTVFRKLQELYPLQSVKAMRLYQRYYMECVGALKEAERYREARKNSRTQIRGGGFSLTGLAKGMVMAGAINLTTGLAHSAYNAIEGAITDSKVRDKIDALFKDPTAQKLLRNGIYIDMYHMSEAVLYFAGVRNCFYTDSKIKSARKLFAAIQAGKVPSYDMRSSMAAVLRDDPFNLPAFHYAVKALGDEGLSEYAEFLGYDDAVKAIRQLSSRKNSAAGNNEAMTELILVKPSLLKDTLERLRREGGAEYYFGSFGRPLVYCEGLTVGYEAAVEAATKTYAHLQEGEVPILCYDTSAYDDKKTHGLLVTNAGFHHQSSLVDIYYPRFVPFNQIQKIVIGGNDIEVWLVNKNKKITTKTGRQLNGHKLEVAKLGDITIPLKNVLVALTDTAKQAYEKLSYTSVWVPKTDEDEPEMSSPELAKETAHIINAPMPGEILQIFVSEGERVKMGQLLLTINAMNIINEILADRSGFVHVLHVRPHQEVEYGNPLVEIGDEKPRLKNTGNTFQETTSRQAIPCKPKASKSDTPSSDIAYNFYAKGRDAEQAENYEEAARLYAQAANHGNCAAMLAIADMCIEGRGVMKEIDKGRAWLQQAANRGSTEAKERLFALDGTPIVYETPKAEKTSPKSPGLALLLCLFNLAGLAGLHRFYVGRWITGILYLCTFGFYGLGSLFDIFMMFRGSFCDDDGLPLKWG